jgi:ABC-type enterobactin transport system permease subunit
MSVASRGERVGSAWRSLTGAGRPDAAALAAGGRWRLLGSPSSVLLVCVVLLAAAMTAGVALGSVGVAPLTVWRVVFDHLAGRPQSSTADAIVWEIRLPRVLLAATVGAALTTAGTVVQVLVRNALADPFLLGISSGASVGATSVLLFGAFVSLGLWALSFGSILGALGAMILVFVVSRQGGRLGLGCRDLARCRCRAVATQPVPRHVADRGVGCRGQWRDRIRRAGCAAHRAFDGGL